MSPKAAADLDAFVAIQSGGSAGGVRLSKFSFIVPWCQQGIHGRGVGVGPAAAKVLTSSLSVAAESDARGGYPESLPSLTTGAENAIAANKSTPAETRQAHRKTFRHADDVDAPFWIVRHDADFTKKRAAVSMLSGEHTRPACWRWRPRQRDFSRLLDQASHEAPEKFVSARHQTRSPRRPLPRIATPAHESW